MPRGRWVMNKETKIGLLVGLAFIIVIGVLLSDHIQSATVPPRAEIATAPGSANRAVVAPGSQSPGVVPVTPPNKIEPIAIVPTPDALNQKATPGPVVVISPGDAQPEAQTASAAGQPNGTEVLNLKNGNPQQPLTAMQAEGASGTLVTGPRQTEMTVPLGNQTGGTTVPANNGLVSHTAVEGDSLYKMTIKYYGKYTKAGSDLILKANPTMGPKGEKIAIGKAYVIPPFPGTTANPVTPAPNPAIANNTQTPSRTSPPATPKPQLTVKTYTVKDGDSLWKIANKQLTGGHTIAELKALNKDVLKGTDVVRPGMVLKIPTGEVASAE